MMKAVLEMKKIFIQVLYIDTKYMKRSMYRMQNTSRYISWVLQDRPIRTMVSSLHSRRPELPVLTPVSITA